MTQPWQEKIEDLNDDVGKANKLFFGLAAGLCLGFLLWSYFGKLDIASVAMGEVTPSSRVKSVQHLEGGIVKEILIREGEKVKKGQTLISLEKTRSSADLKELQVRLVSLSLAITRLEGEAVGAASIEFDEETATQYPDLVEQASARFRARQDGNKAKIEAQRRAIVQREKSIEEIEARISNTRKSLKLVEEQIAISNDLLKEKVTSRYSHIELLREKNALVSRIEEDRAALNGAKAALGEARQMLTQIETSYQEEVQSALEASRREYDEFYERLAKVEDSFHRTVITSPVEGVVKKLYIHTVGGVIRAGEPVVDVVPANDKLIIEAALSTQDIGYVRVGQDVNIRLSAPELSRFGKIEGRVIHVSPDTLVSEDNVPFYQVKVETEKDHFSTGTESYQLYPGIQVTANILTGQRRILEYLLEPVVGSMNDAFLER